VRRCVSFAVVLLGVALAAGGAGAAKPKPKPPAPPSGSQLDAFAQPPHYTSLASERIYFVMTDRYANGDPSNDTGGKSGGRDVTGFDPADIGYFHGGDFKGLTGNCTDPEHGLMRIKDLGFNGIWVTPPFGQKTVQGDSAAYHGYWIEDFTAVDPHLGTEQDFANFVSCAHSLGIKVYLDVVVNHTADVIGYTDGTSFLDPLQRPYRDCKGKTFNPQAYVGKSTFPCLKASTMPHTPFVPPDEVNAKKPAWLNDVTNYHDRGDIDFSSCSDICYQQGDVFGLDDLFTEKPAVVQGLADVYAEWIRKYKIDGFRIDTARHLNPGFFKQWVPKILSAAQQAGVSDFQMFGEVPITDDQDLSTYVRDQGLPNVLDFPFQDVAVGLASGHVAAAAMANRLQDDDYFTGPSGIASTPATFLGNHDMGRAALKLEQAGVSGDALLPRLLLGYDLLYLLRGAPVVYYGDEVGMIGTGGDKQARQDMFPTQVNEWKTQDRVGSPPIGNGSSFDVTNNPIETRLRELGALRDQVPALSTGATIVRSSAGKVLVVSRIDAAAHWEYVAAFNADTVEKTVTVQTSTPARTWTELFGPPGVRSSAGTAGMLTLTLPPLSAALLSPDSSINVRTSAAPAPTLKIGPDDASALWRLAATAPGGDVGSVGFAVWRKGTGWQRVAADDSPPYRGFVKPGSFKKKERAYGVAIFRTLDGLVSVSKVVGFVPRP
jgi:glycosidase